LHDALPIWRRRVLDPDRDAAGVGLGGRDVHAHADARRTAPTDPSHAAADADRTVARALAGALQQHAVRAQAGGFPAQVAHQRVGLVLRAIGERPATHLQPRDLLVAARRPTGVA